MPRSHDPRSASAGARSSLFRRLTAIGRPLDPRWGTNVAIAAATPLAGAAAAGVRIARDGVGVGAVLFGAAAALALFGGWALARELAPDAQATAFVSAIFGWLAVLFIPDTGLLLLFTALLVVRVVNRTVGLPATVFDLASVVGLGAYAMVSTGNPLVGPVVLAALVLDGLLHPRNRSASIAAGVMAAVSVLFAVGRFPLPAGSAPASPSPSLFIEVLRDAGASTGGLLLPFLVLLLATGRLVARSGTIRSVGDATGSRSTRCGSGRGSSSLSDWPWYRSSCRAGSSRRPPSGPRSWEPRFSAPGGRSDPGPPDVSPSAGRGLS